MKNFRIILLFIPVAVASCISQFTPEIVSQSSYLTVNGLITDENRCYTVNLGISHPLDETADEIPATKASVYVTDDLGNSYSLKEKKPGKYVSDSTIFTGQAGRSYALSIKYNGKQYVSSSCRLRTAPPVDSLGYEIYEREINASGGKEKAIRVALSTLDPQKECHYFRWAYEETWEMHLPFNNLPREKRYCWKTELSHNILIANTEALSEDRIKDLTLTTFNNSTDRVQFRYSILARQYAVSREEYEFWNSVRIMSENTGGLYDVTPVSVTGNIQCINYPDDIVLGFFSVSGVSQKRIFIKNQLVVPDIYTENCVEDRIGANYGLPGLGTIIFVLNVFENPDTGALIWEITSNKGCTDCANYGSNTKPGYWDEGFAK